MSKDTPLEKKLFSGSTPQDEADLVQVGYRFAFSLTNNRHDAEDLVQQGCYRVIASKGRLSSRGYLLTAIRNLFYDGLRRKKLIAFEPIEEMNDIADKSSSSALGTSIDLETSLEQLNAEDREVIYLHCVEGYTAAELANLLGKPRSTILNIISRAKAQLICSHRAMEAAPQPKGVTHGFV